MGRTGCMNKFFILFFISSLFGIVCLQAAEVDVENQPFLCESGKLVPSPIEVHSVLSNSPGNEDHDALNKNFYEKAKKIDAEKTAEDIVTYFKTMRELKAVIWTREEFEFNAILHDLRGDSDIKQQEIVLILEKAEKFFTPNNKYECFVQCLVEICKVGQLLIKLRIEKKNPYEKEKERILACFDACRSFYMQNDGNEYAKFLDKIFTRGIKDIFPGLLKALLNEREAKRIKQARIANRSKSQRLSHAPYAAQDPIASMAR